MPADPEARLVRVIPTSPDAVPAVRDSLLDFFNPDRLSESLDALGFHADDAMQALVGIIRDPNAKNADRLRALANLRVQVKEALSLSGRLATVSEKVTVSESGEERRQMTAMTTVVRELGTTEQMLRGHLGPRKELTDGRSTGSVGQAGAGTESGNEPQPGPRSPDPGGGDGQAASEHEAADRPAERAGPTADESLGAGYGLARPD